MMRRKRFFSLTLILFFGICVFGSSLTWAQPKTHLVKKGDTLWDICEAYYGDPNLWPKLWEMNPFVTNPHLLKPGDVITLLEAVPTKRPEAVQAAKEEEKTEKEEKEIPVKKVEEPKAMPLPIVKGLDVSLVTNVKALGYLSTKEVEPWGFIFASESGRKLLSPGDVIFVKFQNGKVANPGDQFNICQSSPLIKHPITGEKIGYVLSVRARLVIEKPVGLGFGGGDFYKTEGIYKGRIQDFFNEMNVGDMVLPYEPVSPCVQPISMNQPLIGNIVASEDQLNLLAKDAVVYLDHGFNDGVRRGHLFEVVKVQIVPDPDRKLDYLASQSRIILPDIPIGIIIVLESRPETSTAVVLSASEEFGKGTYIKGLSWVEAPKTLLKIPDCPTE